MTDLPVQDGDVPEPTVPLRVVLGLLRALAGRRGRSSVTWWGAGFAYTLQVRRIPQLPVTFDSDPDAMDVPRIESQLRDVLRP